MTNEQRTVAYLRQNGSDTRLTPAQRRRLAKKRRKALKAV